jgi:hypothetical protein
MSLDYFVTDVFDRSLMVLAQPKPPRTPSCEIQDTKRSIYTVCALRIEQRFPVQKVMSVVTENLSDPKDAGKKKHKCSKTKPVLAGAKTTPKMIVTNNKSTFFKLISGKNRILRTAPDPITAINNTTSRINQ